MAASRQDEIERKYEVGSSVVLPTLAGADGIASMSRAVEHHLEAVYFDTRELVLARRGITLRRRTGGEDEGWHLKLPAGRDTRTELRVSLAQPGTAVPVELLDPVRALVRDRAMIPVARVRTRRRQHSLRDADQAVLAQLCDDEVWAERLGEGAPPLRWREWEVELVEGRREVLDVVERRLLAAGAAPAAVASKLRRALGGIPPGPPEPPARKALSRADAGAVLVAHLREQTAELHRQDAAVRADRAESVHRMRIAARRLRSALTSNAPLLAAGSTVPLREELRWLGTALSGARDAQVLRERLHRLLEDQPPELVMGPVRARLDLELGAAERHGRAQALEALDSERYYRLLDALDDVLRAPPVRRTAETPAATALPRLLRRDAKRLRRAVRATRTARGEAARDAALHEARKKAKRLRYAAESAEPVLGGRAGELAAAAKRVQEALGEHQDTVVARQRLREYAVTAHLSGENGFTFGRLHGLEEARARECELAFRQAWQAFPRGDLRRWLRRG